MTVRTVPLLAALVLALTALPVAARSVDDQRKEKVAQIPTCARPLGTISVIEPEDARDWWTGQQLPAPSKLIKLFVSKSRCFTLVDRGAGMDAAMRERALASGGELRGRSNIGKGQIKAADYVLQPEIQGANSNVHGSAVGGAIGGLVGGAFGGLVGGMKSRKLEANTVLSVTNVRTTETIATVEGYAAKNDISFGAGGGFFGGIGVGAVGGGYDNTDIGRIVTLAFIDAYAKLVTELGGVQAGDAGTAEASPTKSFSAIAPVILRKAPAPTGGVIRTLAPGSIVYPTGNKNGLWWEVADENDNVGWVLNTKLQPAK